MKAKILKSEAEYRAALSRIEELMDATPDSPEEDDLELWSLLVERYEQQHFPIDCPDPVEAIRFRMDQEGLRQKDLADILPGKNRVSEVLHRKRPLTLGMIQALHHALGIPAEVLIGKAKDPAEKSAGKLQITAAVHLTKNSPVRKPAKRLP